jgi:MFS family permease
LDDSSLRKKYSRYALGLLFAVNLLNYIDRQVLYAVFPLIKEDLILSDTSLGFLGSAFMICYMVSAPALGRLGDRMSRVKLASSGVAVWSLATLFSGIAPGYRFLLSTRAAVGIGEASFGTVSPGLISDFFSREKRGRVLSYFYLAIPVGSALGYLLGGLLGKAFGWHAAFLIVGLPGLAIALPLRFLREPPRGGVPQSDPRVSGNVRRSEIRTLANRSFITNTLSMAAMTFALGGLAQWVPTFLYRVHGMDLAAANTLFGAVTVLAGITGTLTGGMLGDRLQKKSAKGYSLVSGWGLLIGTPIAVYALLARSLTACMTAMLFAEFFLFLNTGPLNTVIVNVTKPSLRATAFAVNIFFIHALGDAISPALLGRLSDTWGLRTALLVTPFAILIAAFFSFLCTRSVEKDSVH